MAKEIAKLEGFFGRTEKLLIQIKLGSLLYPL